MNQTTGSMLWYWNAISLEGFFKNKKINRLFNLRKQENLYNLCVQIWKDLGVTSFSVMTCGPARYWGIHCVPKGNKKEWIWSIHKKNAEINKDVDSQGVENISNL